MFGQDSIPNISLDSAGLVALADLKCVTQRTVLMGSSYLDVFVLAPGIHMQQNASEENGNELPECGAMTNGYVFRVENPAMVAWLQSNGLPGHLTTVKVSESGKMIEGDDDIEKALVRRNTAQNIGSGVIPNGKADGKADGKASPAINAPDGARTQTPTKIDLDEAEETVSTQPYTSPSTLRRLPPKSRAHSESNPAHGTTVQAEEHNVSWSMKYKQQGRRATLLYFICCALTVVTIVLLGVIRDWWAVGVVGVLMAARLINTIIVQQRAEAGWKGAPEVGVRGDLLVLLSQDRWFRIQGYVDDIKAVTAGQWLRDMNRVESSFASFATLLVFVTAALAGNSSTMGSFLMAALLLISAGLLGLANNCTPGLSMYGRFVQTVGEPKKYIRRLDMVNDLIKETGRNDWAVAMRLIKADESPKA
jgi:hypothetical protein